MFQSLHALGDLIRRQRTEIYVRLGHRVTGIAACEILDELAALIATITDRFPAAAPVTRSGIMDYGDRAIAISANLKFGSSHESNLKATPSIAETSPP